MVWEWRLRRCFEDFAEAFEIRGWELCFGRAELPPLLAYSGDYLIMFDRWDDFTGKCWFELRDGSRQRIVYVDDVPDPGRAAELLAEHGAPREQAARRTFAEVWPELMAWSLASQTSVSPRANFKCASDVT